MLESPVASSADRVACLFNASSSSELLIVYAPVPNLIMTCLRMFDAGQAQAASSWDNSTNNLLSPGSRVACFLGCSSGLLLISTTSISSPTGQGENESTHSHPSEFPGADSVVGTPGSLQLTDSEHDES